MPSFWIRLGARIQRRVRMNGILCLEDGFFVTGNLIDSSLAGPKTGEVVFFTGMTGYEEAITDPSYRGQILVFSFPMIGNYRLPSGFGQSQELQVKGIVARDVWMGSSRNSANWPSLPEYAANFACPVLTNVDTRSLVLHLRSHGSMKGVIAPLDISYEDAQRTALLPDKVVNHLISLASTHSMKALVREVCAKEPRIAAPKGSRWKTCVLMDFGAKSGIVNQLTQRGCLVHVMPPWTAAEEIRAIKPDFLLLSNGPGDPEDNVEAIACVRALLGEMPIYGICLGHQIIALALGAGIKKLKYGHHGANHPVKDLQSGRVFVTSQNHNFAVDEAHIPSHVRVTYRNVNDGTVEGISVPQFGVASVQFHPEGGPGPAYEQFWTWLDRSAASA